MAKSNSRRTKTANIAYDMAVLSIFLLFSLLFQLLQSIQITLHPLHLLCAFRIFFIRFVRIIRPLIAFVKLLHGQPVVSHLKLKHPSIVTLQTHQHHKRLPRKPLLTAEVGLIYSLYCPHIITSCSVDVINHSTRIFKKSMSASSVNSSLRHIHSVSIV